MHILVLQHETVEHPGVFRDFLKEDGHTWVPVELNKGEELPALDGFDAVWAMGGPMDVWEEAEHPWLVKEKEFIRNAVEVAGLPFLGLCLGHQLLAEALGGKVGPSEIPEVGVKEVMLTEAGATGVFFDGVADRFECLQWHSAEVQQMPAGASCLATSPDCAVQAMRWGTRAYSMQFHVEIESETVPAWSEIPAYAASLNKALGPGAIDTLVSECQKNMDQFNNVAERVYINWLQTSAQA